MKRIVIAAVALMCLWGSAAQAAPSPGDGIANARAAGIAVDPDVERLMSRAPVGSCPNDPTLDHCTPVNRVVRSQAFFGLEEADDAEPIASASQVYNLCRVKTSYPYLSSGYALTHGENQCDPGVQEHWLYLQLKKKYDGSWYQMDTQEGHDWGSGSILRTARYSCTAKPNRYWWAQATGYSIFNGVMYAGAQNKYAWLWCG